MNQYWKLVSVTALLLSISAQAQTSTKAADDAEQAKLAREYQQQTQNQVANQMQQNNMSMTGYQGVGMQAGGVGMQTGGIGMGMGGTYNPYTGGPYGISANAVEAAEQAELARLYQKQTHPQVKGAYIGVYSKTYKVDVDHLKKPATLAEAEAEILALNQARATEAITSVITCNAQLSALQHKYGTISQNGGAVYRAPASAAQPAPAAGSDTSKGH